MVVGRGVVVVVVEVVEEVVDVDVVLVVVAENKSNKEGQSTCYCKVFCLGKLILFPSNIILNYYNNFVTFTKDLDMHIARNF